MLRNPSDPVPRRTAGWLPLLALFYAGFASAGFSILKPLVVGALIDDYQFSAREAGLVAGAEMLGIGLASMLVGTLGGRWQRQRLIAWGAIIGLAGTVGPAFSAAFLPVMGLRFAAGMGAGLVAAAVISTIGRMQGADRLFGLYFMSCYAGAALLFPMGFRAVSVLGATGAYLLLAALMLPIFLVRAGSGVFHGESGKRRPQSTAFPFAQGGLVLGASFFLWIGNGAIWAFIERFGLRSGLDAPDVGMILSVGQLACIGGGLVAALIHLRFGRALVTFGAIGIAATAVLLIGQSGGWAFAAGALLFSFAWTLQLTYLNGAMSAADGLGRVVALAVASQTIGMAVGQAAAGISATLWGYETIILLAVSCQGVAAVLLVPFLVKLKPMSLTVPVTAMNEGQA